MFMAKVPTLPPTLVTSRRRDTSHSLKTAIPMTTRMPSRNFSCEDVQTEILDLDHDQKQNKKKSIPPCPSKNASWKSMMQLVLEEKRTLWNPDISISVDIMWSQKASRSPIWARYSSFRLNGSDALSILSFAFTAGSTWFSSRCWYCGK